MDYTFGKYRRQTEFMNFLFSIKWILIWDSYKITKFTDKNALLRQLVFDKFLINVVKLIKEDDENFGALGRFWAILFDADINVKCLVCVFIIKTQTSIFSRQSQITARSWFSKRLFITLLILQKEEIGVK